MEYTKFIGLDAHKKTIVIAVADAGRSGEVREYGTISNTAKALDGVVNKLSGGGRERLLWCYEAGPCGYAIYRRLNTLKQDCQVIAPALIPVKAGDRVKTDRRDAINLARFLRAGELTAVKVPDGEQEALRDLCRAREDAKKAELVARQRLLAFLLRHAKTYGGKNWSEQHMGWLSEQKMGDPAPQVVLQEYVHAVNQATERVVRLTRQVEDYSKASTLGPGDCRLSVDAWNIDDSGSDCSIGVRGSQPLHTSKATNGVYGACAERKFQRGEDAAWKHYQDGQPACQKDAGGERLVVPTPGSCQPCASQTAARALS